MKDWSPEQYLKFADERTRPARDLLAQVPLAAPGLVYDLGCGPGNSTQLLVDAWPDTQVTGVDNSPAMLQQARRACPRAAFIEADLSGWRPEGSPDLLFSNATFQWVPDHLKVLERLLRGLKPGAVLAVQMPDNLNEPSHQLMAETGRDRRWSGKLAEAAAARDRLPAPHVYYNTLKPLCARFDIWHTIYNHRLEGARGIVEWVKSTGLRPWLDPLNASERAWFLADYENRLATAYPADAEGMVFLRFPRLFAVAVR